MQGKNTVVFITNGNNVPFSLIKNALNKDTSMLGITVGYDQLTTGWSRATGKTKRVLNNSFLKPICGFLHKFFKNVKEREEWKGTDGTKAHKVHNMFFRFAPSAVAVSDGDALEAMKNAVKKAEMKMKIFLICHDVSFDYDLIDKSVSHYFVDNITVRNELLKRGVYAYNIHVGPIPVEEKFFAPPEEIVDRRDLGLGGEGTVLLLIPTEENAEKMLEIARETEDRKVAVLCGESEMIKELATEKGFAVFDGSADKAAVLAAADAVAMAYDGYLAKCVAALKKDLFLYGSGQGREEALLREGTARCFLTRGELERGLEEAKAEEEKKFDETDEYSQDKIAAKIKDLLNVQTEDS